MELFKESQGYYHYSTTYPHCNNSFTIEDFLDNHLPEGSHVHHIEGSYGEIGYDGKYYGVEAAGDGDFFNHVIGWNLIP